VVVIFELRIAKRQKIA